MSEYIITQNTYAQKIALFEQDHISEIILREGLYDRMGLSYIEKILVQLNSPIVLDVGANMGNHALVMARYAKMVYLFEPQLNIVALLNETKKLNKLDNWHIFPFALGNVQTTLPFYTNMDGNNGASTLVADLKSEHFSQKFIPIHIGDKVIKEYTIPRVDFIKIDVEGFEAEVILGLQETIAQFSPIVCLEWNNTRTKQLFLKEHLLERIFKHYTTKTVTTNYHKSQWHGKYFAALRRIIYKAASKKRMIWGEFQHDFDYQHVFFIPQAKQSLLDKIKLNRRIVR